MTHRARISSALAFCYLCALLALIAGCATPPPNLTPAAVVAFRQTEIIRDLDRVMEVANDAHHTVPPLLSAEVALEVVNWHQTAVDLVHNKGANWQAAAMQGLDELQRKLSAHDRQILAPYLSAVRVLLTEVHP